MDSYIFEWIEAVCGAPLAVCLPLPPPPLTRRPPLPRNVFYSSCPSTPSYLLHIPLIFPPLPRSVFAAADRACSTYQSVYHPMAVAYRDIHRTYIALHTLVSQAVEAGGGDMDGVRVCGGMEGGC